MKLKIFTPLAIQELGTRGNQEDFIYPELGQATDQDCLFILCDGMGGHENGEVASMTFTTALADYFTKHPVGDKVLADETLADAMKHAYGVLDAKDDGGYKKMGTTLTLLYLHRGGITAAHIGDSRIYHIRPNDKLLYVSRDHSLVFDLYQSGEISFDEMKTSKQKNVITRAVLPGEDNRVRPDVIHITDIQPGDYFFMCSDGMLEQMDDEELFRLFSGSGSDQKKLRQLIAATADNDDNHSAYIIHIESVTRETTDSNVNEELTAKCNALNIKLIKERGEEVPVDEDDSTQLAVTPRRKTSRRPAKRKPLSWLWWAMLIAIIVAVAVWLTLYGLQDNHKQAVSHHDTELNSTQPTDKSVLPPVLQRRAAASGADSHSRENAAQSATKRRSTTHKSDTTASSRPEKQAAPSHGKAFQLTDSSRTAGKAN